MTKKTRMIVAKLVLSFVFMAFMYLLLAFYYVSLDISGWLVYGRFIFSVLSFFGVIGVIFSDIEIRVDGHLM